MSASVREQIADWAMQSAHCVTTVSVDSDPYEAKWPGYDPEWLAARIEAALNAVADVDIGVYKGTREQAIEAGIRALRGDDE